MRLNTVFVLACLVWVIGGLAPHADAGTLTGKVTAAGIKDIRDVVVYIGRIEGKTFEPPTAPYIVNQIKKAYVPHVLPILKGGSVTFLNSDALLHNIHTYRGRVSLFNLAMPPGAKPLTKTFAEAGEVTVLCNVHPEMSAYILVLETPYAAITGEDGRYEISDLPAGTYTLKTWHETLKPTSHTVSLQETQTVTVDLELK